MGNIFSLFRQQSISKLQIYDLRHLSHTYELKINSQSTLGQLQYFLDTLIEPAQRKQYHLLLTQQNRFSLDAFMQLPATENLLSYLESINFQSVSGNPQIGNIFISPIHYRDTLHFEDTRKSINCK